MDEHIADVVDTETGEKVGTATVVYDYRPGYPVSVNIDPLPAGYGLFGSDGQTVTEALARLIEHVPTMTHGNYIVVPIDPRHRPICSSDQAGGCLE